MGSIGSSTTSNIISTSTFEQAVTENKSANRRNNLANLMFPAKKGTVLNISDSYTLTKEEDAPGGIWVDSEGLRQYGDDWVKVLANLYKRRKR